MAARMEIQIQDDFDLDKIARSGQQYMFFYYRDRCAAAKQ